MSLTWLLIKLYLYQIHTWLRVFGVDEDWYKYLFNNIYCCVKGFLVVILYPVQPCVVNGRTLLLGWPSITKGSQPQKNPACMWTLSKILKPILGFFHAPPLTPFERYLLSSCLFLVMASIRHNGWWANGSRLIQTRYCELCERTVKSSRWYNWLCI